LGGLDPAGNLKVAAQLHGTPTGDKDFWPGPLDPETGGTDQTACSKWDRFFTVKGSNIELHIKNFKKAQADGVPYDPDLIPLDVKGWPGRGNPFFEEINNFALPNTRQGLAGFWDEDGDMDYNPEFGDYPIIEIRGCEGSPQYPDEMIFWIYNDNGNIHSESRGDAIQMEVQVQAFAYATNNELNDMTFQRYKLINRAIEDIDSTFFAMFTDPDLGCYTDDYVGCDTSRSLAYVYNIDAADGQTGCTCPQGVNTYCENIPILGIDYFRGPLRYDENPDGSVDTVEIGMSSFTYFNNAGVTPTPAPGTTDPNNAQEYYNYLTGSWRDGTPFTYGGDANQPWHPHQICVHRSARQLRQAGACVRKPCPPATAAPFRLRGRSNCAPATSTNSSSGWCGYPISATLVRASRNCRKPTTSRKTCSMPVSFCRTALTRRMWTL
jgi:hypothetical protein